MEGGISLGKITVMVPKDVEDDLRDYVAKKYPRATYGKLGKVVSKAVRYYLDHIGKTIFQDD